MAGDIFRNKSNISTISKKGNAHHRDSKSFRLSLKKFSFPFYLSPFHHVSYGLNANTVKPAIMDPV